ncbi:hypothetical protein [Brevibacillus laterosporus]|uniref:hypothetical protein n=1 Tax=Brevibacillus laterosporus TaxID=1465 RepID=UPI000839B803|nr:hypothetical protein [Brevibacillus laterosporus]
MKEQGNIPLLVAGIIGSIKLLVDTLGYQIITDDQVNAIGNGVSAVVTILAVLLNNRQAKQQ